MFVRQSQESGVQKSFSDGGNLAPKTDEKNNEESQRMENCNTSFLSNICLKLNQKVYIKHIKSAQSGYVDIEDIVKVSLQKNRINEIELI